MVASNMHFGILVFWYINSHEYYRGKDITFYPNFDFVPKLSNLEVEKCFFLGFGKKIFKNSYRICME